MSRSPRVIIGLLLAGLAYWLFTRIQALNAIESTEPTTVVLYFLGFLTAAITAGVLLTMVMLPAVGYGVR